MDDDEAARIATLANLVHDAISVHPQRERLVEIKDELGSLPLKFRVMDLGPDAPEDAEKVGQVYLEHDGEVFSLLTVSTSALLYATTGLDVTAEE